MKPILNCKIHYYPSTHLSQIYDGFAKLIRKGIINATFIRVKGNPIKPLLKVVVDDKYTLIYDLLDGLNWIAGNEQENLTYFKENVKADYYFKRSLTEKVLKYSPPDCKIFPLGLNYPFQAEGKYPDKFIENLKFKIKGTYFYRRTYKKTLFNDQDFEFLPVPAKKTKILFITRLWNPDDVSTEFEKEDRNQLNKRRVANVRALQKEFGNLATAGIKKIIFQNLMRRMCAYLFQIPKGTHFYTL